MIHHGDCIEVMATFDAESIDAIVTDPPYGLEFMGKEWDRLEGSFSDGSFKDFRLPSIMASKRNVKCPDCSKWLYDHPGRKCECGGTVRSKQRTMQDWHEAWAREAFRVAKPGAHMLAFGGTRTYHRLAAAIEDAGWEIRDTLVWAYASGFPKSLNLQGEWQGWGTALKPAWEPIVLARKPLRGTVAGNVTEYGTGALNIDGCRIDGSERSGGGPRPTRVATGGFNMSEAGTRPDGGRWPANVILTDPIFDGDTPGVVGGGEAGGGFGVRGTEAGGLQSPGSGWGTKNTGEVVGYGDSGTYSRFFLIPKAARTDREPVLGGLPYQLGGSYDGNDDTAGTRKIGTRPDLPNRPRANVHPTVKPTDLMRHLVRLVTPPGGTVLDPFLGSGSTGLAAEMEGFEWVGIEREAEYVAIAEARLNGTQRGLGLS